MGLPYKKSSARGLLLAVAAAVVLKFVATSVSAQTALEYFTNHANPLMHAQFGFDVSKLPVCNQADPSIRSGPARFYQVRPPR